MVVEAKYLHGVGAFEVYILKVSALKLSHPSACPVFKGFKGESRKDPTTGGKGLLKFGYWLLFGDWYLFIGCFCLT